MATATKKRNKAKDEAIANLPKWEELLRKALNEPGVISECYSTFHNYSVGNQMLALWQCMSRGIEPGPIATYNKWRDLGRKVISGPGSAIYLCQPVSWMVTDKDEAGNETKRPMMKFTYKPHWFVLSQTEGADYVPPELPGWDIGEACVGLEIEPIPFTMTNGNVMGYATGRSFAINPVGTHETATMMHELAHIVLGHTEEVDYEDGKTRTPRDIRELEAEATAMLVLDALGEKDHKQSRGYIQGWYKENEVPEDSARRIFTAANKILSEGRKVHTGEEDA